MNALVTIAIGHAYEKIGALTHPSIAGYASRIGAEFIVLRDQLVGRTSPHFEKFRLFELLNQYERIIYFDTDLIVRHDCPNLFEIVPKNVFGAVNEGKYIDRNIAMSQVSKEYNIELNSYDGKYYNTGVMILSRAHKELFRKPESEHWNFYEQSYLNLMLRHLRIPVFDLDFQFNRMHCMDSPTGEHRLRSYIVHYAGVLNGLASIIPSDLERWDRGEHRSMKRNIMIGVGAKLGDNICAEPVIRQLVVQSPDCNIKVVTNHLELFSHLPIQVVPFGKENDEPDTPYYRMDTTFDEHHPLRKVFNPDHMYAIDFISLLCLGRTLPALKKSIRLPVSAKALMESADIVGDGIARLSNLILVHPGRSWASKTFPVEWWNKVISELAATHQVGIIGQDISAEAGVLDVKAPQGSVDFRNLLSISGLIALISKAKVLVTNDSSPLHVAGAFDHQIVLIPTCKHPDLIIPWRHGFQNYKTKVLYKRLLCDDMPFDPIQRSGRLDVLPKDIMEYLPDARSVSDAAKESFSAE